MEEESWMTCSWCWQWRWQRRKGEAALARTLAALKVGQQARQAEQEVTMALHLQRKASLRRKPRTSRRNSARVAIERIRTLPHESFDRRAVQNITHACKQRGKSAWWEKVRADPEQFRSVLVPPVQPGDHHKQAKPEEHGWCLAVSSGQLFQFLCWGGTNWSNLCLDSLSACDLDFFG